MHSQERRDRAERRRVKREQRRRAADAARAERGAGGRWRSLRRAVILALALAALAAGGVAAGYGIAAMRAVGSPADLAAPPGR